MIPDVPRSAIATITLPINFFHSLAVLSLPHEAETITPHTRIPPKQTRRIIVVIILVNHHINLGNAVVSVTVVPSVVDPSVPVLIQFPINGTFVLSFTPQQTPGVSHDTHFPSTFVSFVAQLVDVVGGFDVFVSVTGFGIQPVPAVFGIVSLLH